MTRKVQIVTAVAIAAVVVGWWVWRQSGSSPEREVRTLLDHLAVEFNASTTDGLGTVARAARLGDFFSPDVVVEFGQGSPPIHGRETLIGMAARLQPRTAAFELEFDDVNVELAGESRGEVTLTAVIRRRSITSGEESIDAREFAAEVIKTGGRWRISRVVAVDTLR